jgi:heterodisulfide reductase subunit A
VEAPEERLEKLISFLQGRGVHVEKLTQVLQVDAARCTSCGACVSPCPVEAIRFKPDWSVEFIEEKCVGCGICTVACPVRAVKLL